MTSIRKNKKRIHNNLAQTTNVEVRWKAPSKEVAQQLSIILNTSPRAQDDLIRIFREYTKGKAHMVRIDTKTEVTEPLEETMNG